MIVIYEVSCLSFIKMKSNFAVVAVFILKRKHVAIKSQIVFMRECCMFL